MGDFVGDDKNETKIFPKKVKCGIEAYNCLLSKNTWFEFLQRSGAKIWVKYQISFLGVLEGCAKGDS